LSSPRFLRARIRQIVSVSSEIFGYLDWIVGELRRNDPWAISQAGRALGRYNARSWANGLNIPTVMVVTVKDQLVAPEKQHRLAEVMQALTVLLDGDHIVSLVSPQKYASATCIAIDEVLQQLS
jgi:pimeloyl-ACP methyl ester carboxylesterase